MISEGFSAGFLSHVGLKQLHGALRSDGDLLRGGRKKDRFAGSYLYAVALVVGQGAAALNADKDNERVEFRVVALNLLRHIVN